MAIKRKRQDSDEQRRIKKKKVRRILPDLIAIAVFSTLLAIFGIMRTSPSVNEVMVTKVSHNILLVMGRATSAFPISLYEFFLYIVVFAMILNICRILIFLVRRKFLRALSVVLSVVLTVLIVANMYFLSAGFYYARNEQYYPIYDAKLNKQQTVMLADYFISDFNDIAGKLSRDTNGYARVPYSLNELSDRMQQEYLRHIGYNMNDYTPKCKILLSSRVLSEMHITGVFFAPFGEANINGDLPPHEIPFTMAHELAHAKGVMKENTADELALYITLTSDDPFIRYSGYHQMIFVFLDAVWTWENVQGSADYPEYTRLLNRLSPKIFADRKNSIEQWAKYNKFTAINKVVDNIYDKYLKLMGQEEGVAAYIPPDTGIIEQPALDPGGNVVTNPNTGLPIIERVPRFTTIQKIFFQAYKESHPNF